LLFMTKHGDVWVNSKLASKTIIFELTKKQLKNERRFTQTLN
jgi:hypothetical protein